LFFSAINPASNFDAFTIHKKYTQKCAIYTGSSKYL